MSNANNRRRNARFWGGVAVTLIMVQVMVFLYLPVHFFERRSERVADFLIVFLVPLGGFAARLLHAAVPSAGWEVQADRWRTMAMLALLVFVALVAGLAALVLRSDQALRLILANFAVALPLTSISISESFRFSRNGNRPFRP